MSSAYREVRSHNIGTGEAPKTCKFYEDFDSVLGCRDLTTFPEKQEVGLASVDQPVAELSETESEGSVENENEDEREGGKKNESVVTKAKP